MTEFQESAGASTAAPFTCVICLRERRVHPWDNPRPPHDHRPPVCSNCIPHFNTFHQRHRARGTIRDRQTALIISALAAELEHEARRAIHGPVYAPPHMPSDAYVAEINITLRSHHGAA